MAILDAQLAYSDAQALTATAASTNLVDHGIDGDFGVGVPMVCVLSLDVAADGTTGDETYTVDLEADDNSSFSSAVTVGSATITRGDAAGTKYFINVPPSASTERYSRLNFTLAGTTPTATVTARLVPLSFVQASDQYYASGFTVS